MIDNANVIHALRIVHEALTARISVIVILNTLTLIGVVAIMALVTNK